MIKNFQLENCKRLALQSLEAKFKLVDDDLVEQLRQTMDLKTQAEMIRQVYRIERIFSLLIPQMN